MQLLALLDLPDLPLGLDAVDSLLADLTLLLILEAFIDLPKMGLVMLRVGANVVGSMGTIVVGLGGGNNETVDVGESVIGMSDVSPAIGAGVGDEALVAALREKNFIQVPGPNPLLRARHAGDDGDDNGAGASWPGAGTMMEFGDVFRDFNGMDPSLCLDGY